MLLPHQNGSFSYKTIDPVIKAVLSQRSVLDNTIQVAQPFIKVTSTVNLPNILGEGNVGFTLGLHAIPEDVRADDIYASKEGNGLIGYTYTQTGQTRKIYAQVTNKVELAGKFFDRGSELATTSTFSHIPPPGITSATIGRNKSGQTQFAQISFSVPTQAQLEMLHRTLLIPGIGTVVEWGQQYAPNSRDIEGQTGLTSSRLKDHMFPWYDRDTLTTLLQRLGRNEVGIQEIITNYVYKTQGQYMWMFGKVANFSTKSNSDGSFECTMKIIGPSENAWAFNTINTIIPPKDASGKICASDANSVYSYFTKTTPGTNLKSLLEKVVGNKEKDLLSWEGHVVKFADKRSWLSRTFSSDSKKPSDATPNTSEGGFGDSEDAYFMTWRFFVNVVLNNETHGIKRIFADASLTDELKKIALLRPYSVDGKNFSDGTPGINDPYENWVGNNENLRSIDPSTMIIVNDTAATIAQQDITTNRPGVAKDLTEVTADIRKFASRGDFHMLSNDALNSDTSNSFPFDRGLLSTGVWLNHKAVVQALAGSDTILAGISNLLQRMSAATSGYWQLTIDISEPVTEFYSTETEHNYAVIDANFRQNSTQAVEKFLQNVHTFNKYIRYQNNELVGSDVLDCSVDLNLPKRLFSQIATLGLVQPGDTDPNEPGAPIINDANDTLRKMFSITSLAEANKDGSSIDLTLQPRDRARLTSTCGGANSQTTAGTAGSGNATSTYTSRDVSKLSKEDLEKEIKKLEKEFSKKEACKTQVCIDQVNAASNAAARISAASSQFQVVYDSVRGPAQVDINQNYRPPPEKSPGGAQLYDAGFRNGRIPQNSMIRITQYAACTAALTFKEPAADLIKMIDAARAAGHQLQYCEGYRSLATQIDCIKNKGWTSGPAHRRSPTALTNRSGQYIGQCAQPGTSTHGWGLAFDLSTTNGGQIRKGTPVHNWLVANAATYGFIQDPAEAWHWEYTRPIVITEPAPTSPTPAATTAPVPTPTPTPAAAPVINTECVECVRLQNLITQYKQQLSQNTQYDQGAERLTSNYDQLSTVFRYIEPFPELMVARIAGTADGVRSNAFGASPGALSINATIELPGIAGLRVGELFWIERIPSYFKAFGAFQSLGIEDKIGPDGWKTSINAKFNYLGDKWRNAVEELLKKPTTSTT